MTELQAASLLCPPVAPLAPRPAGRQMGEETYFKLRMATSMKRVFDTYADRKGVCVTTLRFLLNGERVGCEDTPASLQLGHHDQIDCSREQPGPQDWPFPRTATTAAGSESQGVPVFLNYTIAK